MTDWRSGARGTEALAGQMDRAAARWAPALRPGASTQTGSDPRLRIAQCGWGEGGFPLSPQTTLLITRVMHPTSPTALHLARLPALVRFPRSRRGPCQEHHKTAPPQIFWRRWEEGKESWVFDISKECSMDYVEPHDFAGIRPLFTYEAGNFT